ncbi:MAG: arginase family protein [Deltaproteobacteria bacterium]|nr:arginase family protein [Deltaproteobacteria bacterium]MBW1929541.1 arginase family protein [Deltaproteobacteria bacterium]MBW2024043.1 arginase family protein [Deltaproteobacteria bacterium]MBW2124394.1 arginase family protein [Deltaproteobacteria bacterium]
MERKVIFFGCPLDCDEREEAVREKLNLMKSKVVSGDPYWHVMNFIRYEIPQHLWAEKGSIYVESWLRPVPPLTEANKISTANFVKFLDADGCRSYIAQVKEHVSQIYPDIPCLIAIDHSLSAGAFLSLVEKVGRENISFVVLDSHTDVLTMSSLSAVISYDFETNPSSPFNPNDPFLKDRPESINASSFIYHLISAGHLEPRNLYIVGISDYPPKRAFRIKDPRVQEYVGQFTALKRLGATLLTKKSLVSSPGKTKAVFNSIKTQYVYVSVDLDVGARNALHGVRFLDREGLSEKQIYRIIEYLCQVIEKGTQLIGLDVSEFNPRKANPEFGNTSDPTYRIAANIIKKLGFGLA